MCEIIEGDGGESEKKSWIPPRELLFGFVKDEKKRERERERQVQAPAVLSYVFFLHVAMREVRQRMKNTDRAREESNGMGRCSKV